MRWLFFRRLRGGETEKKSFFFEKKNQETFTFLGFMQDTPRLIRIQAGDFSPGAELDALLARAAGAGGLGSFMGVVRSDAARPIVAMTLEHYPAMTWAAIASIVAEAEDRFALRGCTVIHRFGRLLPGDRIVFVAAAASHRRAALDATCFLIDWLKTKAPFWKREEYADGTVRWVEAIEQDEHDAGRWLR
jgi:molybdopterin synthase catalytic subunit